MEVGFGVGAFDSFEVLVELFEAEGECGCGNWVR